MAGYPLPPPPTNDPASPNSYEDFLSAPSPLSPPYLWNLTTPLAASVQMATVVDGIGSTPLDPP